MFSFPKVTLTGRLANAETCAQIYAIMPSGRGIPMGWVGRNADRQWVCWNAYGDFWVSYGATRDAAVQGMLAACWRDFSRRQ